MRKLFFVRFEKIGGSFASNIVFCLTAEDEKEAEAKGFALIADAYRSEYRLGVAEFVCNTPDEVSGFEPC
jgi:hypothetical protein